MARRRRWSDRGPWEVLLGAQASCLLRGEAASGSRLFETGRAGCPRSQQYLRSGLALDLMEEFRSFLADRLVLSLINMKQVKGHGFTKSESGGVQMDDETRKEVLVAYQKRKQDEITHPFLGEKTTVGLLFHLQALLMARYLRGDLDGYPPFASR